jgi:hypothetical protein
MRKLWGDRELPDHLDYMVELPSTRAASVTASLGRGSVSKAIVGYFSGSPKQVAESLELDADLVRQTMFRLAEDGRLDKLERGIYVLPTA